MLDDEMPELVVFSRSDPREVLARSAEAFATSFKCPARLYFGSQEWYFKPQLERTAQRAKQQGIDVVVTQVSGDHFTMLESAIPQSVQFFRSQLQTGPRMTPDAPLTGGSRLQPAPTVEPSAVKARPKTLAVPGDSSASGSPPWTPPTPPSFPSPSPSFPPPPSFPSPPGYTPPRYVPPPRPRVPSPPQWPGVVPPAPRPSGGLPASPPGASPTGAVQPPLVAFVMLGYQGEGDPTEAARQALRSVPWADVRRLHVDQVGGQILVGVRGSSVSTAMAKTVLQQAGFQIGGVSYRPR
jgi:hypothetical protein